MNFAVDRSEPQTSPVLPPQFEALRPAPQLLPGEDVGHYHALQAAIFRDLNPRCAIEWLLAIDIAELSWEIHRYRLLRQRALSAYRQKAVETVLRRIDMAGIPACLQDTAEVYVMKNALDWQRDPSAANDIESRFSSYGFDQHSLNMEAYVQSREVFALFDTLLNGAQLRRLALLKELNNFQNPATYKARYKGVEDRNIIPSRPPE